MNKGYWHSFLSILLCVQLGLFMGCGIYSFSGSSIPSHIKTLAIPLFEDQTAEFGIDQQITDALIETFTKDNSLKISGPRDSDSVIRGSIVSVQDRAGQYDQQETASDFRLTITMKIAFEDVKKRNTLWEETYSHYGTYDNSATTRNDAIQEAIEKITADILNRTVSGW